MSLHVLHCLFHVFLYCARSQPMLSNLEYDSTLMDLSCDSPARERATAKGDRTKGHFDLSHSKVS